MAEVMKIGIYALEGLFLLGIVGSALVVLLSMIEDLEVFVERETPSEEQHSGMMAAEPTH